MRTASYEMFVAKRKMEHAAKALEEISASPQRISLLPTEDRDVFSQTTNLLPLNRGPFAPSVLDSVPIMLCRHFRSTPTFEPSTGLLKKRIDGDRGMGSTRELPLASSSRNRPFTRKRIAEQMIFPRSLPALRHPSLLDVFIQLEEPLVQTFVSHRGFPRGSIMERMNYSQTMNYHYSVKETPTLTRNSHTPNERILVAGSSFRGYGKMIADGFTSCGLNATFLEPRYSEMNLLDDVRLLVSEKNRVRWSEEQAELNSHFLEEAVLSGEPDYVLVVSGARISPTMSRFCQRNNVTLAMWAFDSAQHVPCIKEFVNDYNLVYFYEPDDLPLFPDLANARFLPMAYDPRYYYPIHGDEANLVDICFVGSFDDYPTRTETILRLARKFPDLVLEVSSGPRWRYSPSMIQDRLRFGDRSNLRFERRSLPHDEINKIYSRARICLNIHHAQAKRAVNPRTFEILGSGGFLLTDRRMEGLSDFEIGRDYEFYSSYDELFEKVTYYLQNPEARRLISISGYERVRRNHTYQCRAMSILEDLEKNA